MLYVVFCIMNANTSRLSLLIISLVISDLKRLYKNKQLPTLTATVCWRWADIGTVLCCESGDSGPGSSDPSTPHYNSWIASDLTMQTQQRHIATVLGDSRSLRDAIILLKVWLHQRQLDIV